MPDPGLVIVVCTANICRSPMGEKLLRHALAAEPEPLRSLKVVSAGIAAARGQPATDNSVAALKKVGIDLSGHASQPLTQELLDRALAVFCMTESHRSMIELHFDRVPPMEEILAKVDAVTEDDILRVGGRLFDAGTLTLASIGPSARS